MLSEKEQKQLEALLQKKKSEAIKDRNEKKRNDRMCEHLFDMKVDAVKAALDEYEETKKLIERLYATLSTRPSSLEDFVVAQEKRHAEKKNDGHKTASMNKQGQGMQSLPSPGGSPAGGTPRSFSSEARTPVSGQP